MDMFVEILGCGWLTELLGHRAVCDRLFRPSELSDSPIITYIPRAGAGQGEGMDRAWGGGRGEAAQLRDAAVFGWATWVKWDRRQRRKNKEKKERWRGGRKKQQSVWHTLERESSLASMRQRSGQGGRGGVRSTDRVSAGDSRWAPGQQHSH